MSPQPPATSGRDGFDLPKLPADGSMRWLGWAGLLMPIPTSFRLAKIDGKARKGSLVLADDERPRVEIAWATVTRGRFDAEALLHRRLARVLRVNVRVVAQRVRRVSSDSFDPMVSCDDSTRDFDRFAGYCPHTRRIIDCAYHRGTPREDALVRRHTFGDLIDQRLDQPMRWALFDLSFTAPAGYRYDAAVLNVGDMAVRVSPFEGEYRGPSVTVRQIYPAGVALQRQPLEQWMRDLLESRRQMYALRQVLGRRRGASYLQAVQTVRGEGLFYDARLRWVMRLLFWRQPPRMGIWLIHDQQVDRLLCIQVADQPQRLQPMLQQVLDGLHWA
jgi:hypothetical protein